MPGDDEFQNKKQLLMSSPTFPQCPCLLSDSGSLAHLAPSTLDKVAETPDAGGKKSNTGIDMGRPDVPYDTLRRMSKQTH